jgi:hypothetical protein
MPLPADRVVLPREVRGFLERLVALPTAHWLAAADAFGAARQADALMPLALKSLASVVANASTSPWEATRLQLAWERVEGLVEAVTPLLEAQRGHLALAPAEALGLMRDAALTAATALALGERLSTHAWTLYAPFDPYVPKHGLRSHG